MHACYAINRKAGYVTHYNNNARYPLELWNEYKTQHDFTDEQLADMLLETYDGEKK